MTLLARRPIRALVLSAGLAFAAPAFAAQMPLPTLEPGGVAGYTLTQAQPARVGDEALPDLVERLMPSVVSIATVGGGGRTPAVQEGSPYEEYFRDYFENDRDGARRGSSVGTGFIIDADGHIATNNHVITNATELRVIFHDGASVPAKLIGRDPRADLAIIKIDPKVRKISPVTWGSSEKVRIGEPVVAIGNPFGLGGTVTTGIVSARNRHLQNFGGFQGPSFVDFLQTDAAINKGNSGGPLFNIRGEVIGINTAIFSNTRNATNVGIAFSVPSDLARPILDQLRTHGKTRRGWFGVQIKNIEDDVAKQLGLKNTEGAIVVNTIPGSPAAVAGILAGDVILKFDGKAVVSDRRLTQMVAATEPDKTVDVVIFRKGKEEIVKVKLGELEKAQESGATNPDRKDLKPGENALKLFGMTLSEITPELKEKLKISGEGVAVTAVEEKSQAFEKGMRAGDVIVEMDLAKVTKPADIEAALKKAQAGRKTSVLLLVQRQDDRRFVALRIDQPERPPQPEKK